MKINIIFIFFVFSFEVLVAQKSDADNLIRFKFQPAVDGITSGYQNQIDPLIQDAFIGEDAKVMPFENQLHFKYIREFLNGLTSKLPEIKINKQIIKGDYIQVETNWWFFYININKKKIEYISKSEFNPYTFQKIPPDSPIKITPIPGGKVEVNSTTGEVKTIYDDGITIIVKDRGVQTKDVTILSDGTVIFPDGSRRTPDGKFIKDNKEYVFVSKDDYDNLQAQLTGYEKQLDNNEKLKVEALKSEINEIRFDKFMTEDNFKQARKAGGYPNKKEYSDYKTDYST